MVANSRACGAEAAVEWHHRIPIPRLLNEGVIWFAIIGAPDARGQSGVGVNAATVMASGRRAAQLISKCRRSAVFDALRLENRREEVLEMFLPRNDGPYGDGQECGSAIKSNQITVR